ncbi:fungal pheromone STE3G-protein-coupled receptor [Artomyces pyxidatus]|uniref:Fungal pheromone STE3G-protein-coupled receptor n=1 Tax=Artomyces pyxidatus TaxID=48021 RepID=A0ACB8SIQ8_9AGAM|nr:fungal pheromone STE3G-protein-coupled receptor [Artomyces pyxidatus]
MEPGPPNSVFSAFAFIGFVISLIPLPWHIKGNANVGTCLFMFWSALGCITQSINSRVWDGNMDNPAPIWCDISTHAIILGEIIAISSSILCITRRFYCIVDQGETATRREDLIDFSIGFGMPILVVTLSYTVQGHRFDIYEDVGCWPAIVNTPPSYALVFIWPLVIGLFSGIFGTITMLRCLHHRHRRNAVGTLTYEPHIFRQDRSLFIHCMLFCNIGTVLTFPFGGYLIYLNVTSPSFVPSVSWTDIRTDFPHIDQYPSDVWIADSQMRSNLTLLRWATVLWAFAFFALFGFAKEALRHYSMAWQSLASCRILSQIVWLPSRERCPAGEDELPFSEVGLVLLERDFGQELRR